MALRPRVLNIYKRLWRLSQNWTAVDPSQTGIERDYIRTETSRLFRLNKGLKLESDIQERLLEAEARLAMAEHYRNPYPRPVNLPQGAYSKREGKEVGKAIEKLQRISKPVYVKSIDDSVKK